MYVQKVTVRVGRVDRRASSRGRRRSPPGRSVTEFPATSGRRTTPSASATSGARCAASGGSVGGGGAARSRAARGRRGAAAPARAAGSGSRRRRRRRRAPTTGASQMNADPAERGPHVALVQHDVTARAERQREREAGRDDGPEVVEHARSSEPSPPASRARGWADAWTRVARWTWTVDVDLDLRPGRGPGRRRARPGPGPAAKHQDEVQVQVRVSHAGAAASCGPRSSGRTRASIAASSPSASVSFSSSCPRALVEERRGCERGSPRARSNADATIVADRDVDLPRGLLGVEPPRPGELAEEARSAPSRTSPGRAARPCRSGSPCCARCRSPWRGRRRRRSRGGRRRRAPRRARRAGRPSSFSSSSRVMRKRSSVGPLDGVAERADAARDDRDLVHRVAARAAPRRRARGPSRGARRSRARAG